MRPQAFFGSKTVPSSISGEAVNVTRPAETMPESAPPVGEQSASSRAMRMMQAFFRSTHASAGRAEAMGESFHLTVGRHSITPPLLIVQGVSLADGGIPPRRPTASCRGYSGGRPRRHGAGWRGRWCRRRNGPGRGGRGRRRPVQPGCSASQRPPERRPMRARVAAGIGLGGGVRRSGVRRSGPACASLGERDDGQDPAFGQFGGLHLGASRRAPTGRRSGPATSTRRLPVRPVRGAGR